MLGNLLAVFAVLAVLLPSTLATIYPHDDETFCECQGTRPYYDRPNVISRRAVSVTTEQACRRACALDPACNNYVLADYGGIYICEVQKVGLQDPGVDTNVQGYSQGFAGSCASYVADGLSGFDSPFCRTVLLSAPGPSQRARRHIARSALVDSVRNSGQRIRDRLRNRARSTTDSVDPEGGIKLAASLRARRYRRD